MEEGEGGDKPERPMWDAVCAKCGNACKVPFEPTEGRPVYCRDCYQPKRRF
jgi:CxxC-x17-CxxC domain-containing protein